ncbi:MAG: hypothetical protein HYX90_11970 [Chloroflexi bacterium]|nr:hypothetical protein [Chloroflexota bacterium]
MSAYMAVGLALVLLPVFIGLIGFLSRWQRLAPHEVDPHGKVWGRRCPRCQSEDFAATGDGRQACARCGHIFI